MLTKLWCFLWGHKYFESRKTRYLGDYIYERVDFWFATCPRCGKLLADKGRGR